MVFRDIEKSSEFKTLENTYDYHYKNTDLISETRQRSLKIL
jgi:hypothetical protein